MNQNAINSTQKDKNYANSMIKTNIVSPRIATENNDPYYRNQIY